MNNENHQDAQKHGHPETIIVTDVSADFKVGDLADSEKNQTV